MQPPHVQLSLKLFGVTPEALPPELRQVCCYLPRSS